MIFKSLFFALLLLLATGSAAQTNELGEETARRIDSLFATWDKPDAPGCALGIVKDGRLVYSRGYGVANLDYGIPITTQSAFYIPSTTKQFTAACIALLTMEGKISLDDDIRRYFPELPEYEKPITIRHLIHHTSGIRDYLTLMALAGESYQDYFNLESGIELIARQKALNFPPGEQYLYSNSGYILLAELVGRVTGKTIRRFAHDRIFVPLGMTATFFNDDHNQIIPNRVTSYESSENEYKQLLQNFDALGDGNMISTVEDLYRWDQNFYAPLVGGQAFLDLVHTRGTLNNGDTLDYAFGLVHGTYRGAKTINHGGSMLGFRTQLIRFPDLQFSVILLANSSRFNPNTLAYRIADLLLADQLQPNETRETTTPESISLNSELLESFTGIYDGEQAPGPVRLAVENGTLRAEYLWNGQQVLLLPSSQTEFFAPMISGLRFTFSEIQNGKPQALTIQPGSSRYDHQRVELAPPDPTDLGSYSGKYYSPELDAFYTLSVHDGKLHGQIAKRPPQEARLIGKDECMMNSLRIRFSRNEEGVVDGLLLQAGRVRNLKFTKS